MTEQNPNPTSDSSVPPSQTPPPAEPTAKRSIFSPPPPYTGPEPDSDSRTMGLLAHLLGLFMGFIGALAIWLVKKDQSPFVDDQGKEAVNFQLTMLIGYIVSGLTMCILVGFVLMALTAIAHLVFTIMATMAASKGQAYRYPFSIRFIR